MEGVHLISGGVLTSGGGGSTWGRSATVTVVTPGTGIPTHTHAGESPGRPPLSCSSLVCHSSPHILDGQDCVFADVPLEHAEGGLALRDWNKAG